MADEDLDPCPHCGRVFEHNNKGARANHVDSCDEKPEPTPETAEPKTPARREEPAGKPATEPTSQQDALQAGSTLANMLVSGAGGSPEERADATEQAATALGGLVASAGQQMAEQRRQGADRARGAKQDSIERVDDYVDCPECGAQITNLPEAGSEFDCPGCRTTLRYNG
jgi:adenine-specific DNA methylase